MTRYGFGLALGVALTLLFAAVGIAQRKETPEVAAARKDVLDLAKAIEAGKSGKDIEDKVAAIKKKHELADVMHIYKPYDKGGLGFGAKPEAKSGVESKIIALGRGTKGPAKGTLEKETEDLIQLAYVNIAMGEVVKPYFMKPSEGKTKKDWDKYSDEQKEASAELIKAVKAKNGPDVLKAAKRLNAACNDCHSPFRK